MNKFLILFVFCFLRLTAVENPTIVIFGATGDLSYKKIFPAIYSLAEEGKQFQVVAIGRRPLDEEAFQQMLLASLRNNQRALPFIKENVSYFKTSFEEYDNYVKLKDLLDGKDVLYFLATDPIYFATIIQNLKKSGALEEEGVWRRVIIEKPVGYDLSSAEQLYSEIADHLTCPQTYMIDHYLGKEGVLNILPLRNSELSQLWNHEQIEKVAISLSEKIGIENRGAFWEKTGMLRDVVQNHVLQMLALLTMEMPATDQAIHEEKIKVLNNLRPLPLADIIRAQYSAGTIDGVPVNGYHEEKCVSKDSKMETFVAARLFIDNARWSGVPFYIRAGKRLDKQATEITISFKDKSELYIRVQPNPTIIYNGTELVQPSSSSKDAYAKLISDALEGNQSHYVHIEEIFASWKLFTPVLQAWQSSNEPLELYEAGSHGPEIKG